MYRDDTCAVCGDSLPPDHFYCREHAATVDERLREIGDLLPRVTADVRQLGSLMGQIAQETWDYLAEQQDDDPEWPPVPLVDLHADADEVDVDVDSEPGYVRVQLQMPLAAVLAALAESLGAPQWERIAGAATAAEDLNATH